MRITLAILALLVVTSQSEEQTPTTTACKTAVQTLSDRLDVMRAVVAENHGTLKTDNPGAAKKFMQASKDVLAKADLAREECKGDTAMLAKIDSVTAPIEKVRSEVEEQFGSDAVRRMEQ